MIRRLRLPAALLLLAPFLAAATGRAGQAGQEVRVLGPDTPWATPFYVTDSGRAGPTVVVVAGLHGNEVASTYAAGQIRHWPLRRGRLVIVPRANRNALAAYKRETPDAAEGLGNLNRNFPRAGREEGPRGDRAHALWALVKAEDPDWVLDLHESKDFHRVDPERVGSTLIPTHDAAARAAARLMAAAVDETVSDEQHEFTILGTAVNGSLIRAVGEHLGKSGMICETTTKQPRSLRARQHRLLVHRLLAHLRMIDPALPVDTLLDRSALEGRTAIGLYDAGGAGGKGIPAIWSRLRRRSDLRVLRIGPPEIKAGALDQLDVVIFPGGTGGGQSRALGAKGRAALQRFVRAGGGYVGICAGAYLACRSFSWGAHLLDAATASGRWKRGRAVLEIELTPRGREILGGDAERLRCLYNNGPILVPAEDAGLPDYETLAVFRTEVAKNGTPRNVQIGSPAIACGRCGKGRVIVYSPHPEQTKGLEWLVERGVRWVSKQEDAHGDEAHATDGE